MTTTYTPTDWAEAHSRSAHAAYAAARNKLMAFAAEPARPWSDAVDFANNVAHAAGEIAAANLITSLAIGMSNGLSVADALRAIGENVAAVATDDSWSGKGNDGKRAYRDGYIEVTRRFSSEITR